MSKSPCEGIICDKHLDEFTKVYNKIDIVDDKIDSLAKSVYKSLNKKVGWVALGIIFTAFSGVITYKVLQYDKYIEKLTDSMGVISTSVATIAGSLKEKK